MGIFQIVEIVNTVFGSKMPEPQINSECGAGAMTMMVWENDLILMFQKSRTAENMEFMGWSLIPARGNRGNTIKTMAGIGICPTREELEGTYSLLYGILLGPLKNKVLF